jgi:hypothetical protein
VLRATRATGLLTPLREGGSLPCLLEADDDGTYVVKFRGAGQGTAALVAEVVVTELARRLGLRVPELVLVDLDPLIARAEPDEEVQQLLAASAGRNLGVDFLPGSVGYDGVGWRPPVAEALRIVWLDAYTANIDRTWRNPNLLVWHRELWAIDHGAALVFQHAWPDVEAWARRRYDLSQHVLSPVVAGVPATELADVDAELTQAVSPQLLREVLALVPDGWLLTMNSVRATDPRAAGAQAAADRWRDRYTAYLTARLAAPRPWRREAA